MCIANHNDTHTNLLLCSSTKRRLNDRSDIGEVGKQADMALCSPTKPSFTTYSDCDKWSWLLGPAPKNEMFSLDGFSAGIKYDTKGI